MKKAINEKFGGLKVIKLIDAEVPDVATNEVLVKVQAAGLNPKDILVRKGKFKHFTGRKMPQSIGFDFSGIIEDANGNNFKKSDKVFGMLNGWKGRCCAGYVNVSIDELYKMPNNITFEEAAGIPLAGQTALQALRDIGQVKEGQAICINGASGGVGTMAIQIAKELGGQVTTISSSKNLDLCQSLGADTSLTYEEIDILNGKEKFDVFFDIFGNYSFKKTTHLLTTRGKYVTTVPKPDIFKEQIWNFFRTKKAKIVVVKSKTNDIRWLYEKISEGKIKPIVDKIYELDEIKDAQEYIELKRAKGKVILRISTSPNIAYTSIIN